MTQAGHHAVPWPDARAEIPALGWRHFEAWDGAAMGGRLAINVTLPVADDAGQHAADDREAGRLAGRTARRVATWAGRLTRFDPSSELSRLNAERVSAAEVRPTLAGVLSWAECAAARTGGITDITLLAERLAAEQGVAEDGRCPREIGWRLERNPRGGTVFRSRGLTFDLDGVAKGWIADRALGLLSATAGAIVDADGDIAIRVAPGDSVELGVADPRGGPSPLACLRLDGPGAWSATYGVATSGVTVHRWLHGDGPPAHHLIDPRTRRPAETDVAQATVLARTARDAEVLAKTAVILGQDAGLRFLDDAGALAAIVVTDGGACVAIPRSLAWLTAA